MKKSLKVLVTAGDTYESIDEVRRITHMATGRLGSLIADEFVQNDAKVTFLCGEHSLQPTLSMEKIVKISGVMDLQNTIIELLSNTEFDCVIHSMAVSDYVIQGIATKDDIVNGIAESIIKLDDINNSEQLHEQIQQAITDSLYTATKKISSDHESVAVLLDRAPKVISLVKQMQENVLLVGFKLLVDISEHELLEAAQKQMLVSGSDFVLANDLSAIAGDEHSSILIDSQGILDRPTTKHEIAKSIVFNVMNRLEKVVQ